MGYQNECHIGAPHSETQPMKKFLLLAALPFLFATYSNAATPKAEALKPASAHKQTKQRFPAKSPAIKPPSICSPYARATACASVKPAALTPISTYGHPKTMKPYLTVRHKAINLTVSLPNRANIKCRSI